MYWILSLVTLRKPNPARLNINASLRQGRYNERRSSR